jgi:hypothetical protein
VLGVADSVFDVGAHPVPRLQRGGLGRGRHVEVSGDERACCAIRSRSCVDRSTAPTCSPRIRWRWPCCHGCCPDHNGWRSMREPDL